MFLKLILVLQVTPQSQLSAPTNIGKEFNLNIPPGTPAGEARKYILVAGSIQEAEDWIKALSESHAFLNKKPVCHNSHRVPPSCWPSSGFRKKYKILN